MIFIDFMLINKFLYDFISDHIGNSGKMFGLFSYTRRTSVKSGKDKGMRSHDCEYSWGEGLSRPERFNNILMNVSAVKYGIFKTFA